MPRRIREAPRVSSPSQNQAPEGVGEWLLKGTCPSEQWKIEGRHPGNQHHHLDPSKRATIQQKTNIHPHQHQLPTTKGRPISSEMHVRWQPHQLPRPQSNSNSISVHHQTPHQQRLVNAQCQILFRRHQGLLPSINSTRSRIHNDPF